MSLANVKDNPGSVVNVVSWFLLVATTLAVIVRLATKQAVSHEHTGDDVVVLAALVRCASERSKYLSVSARKYVIHTQKTVGKHEAIHKCDYPISASRQ